MWKSPNQPVVQRSLLPAFVSLLLITAIITPAPVFAQKKTDVNRWAILIGVDDYIQANDL